MVHFIQQLCLLVTIFLHDTLSINLKMSIGPKHIMQYKRNYSPYGQKYYENYVKNLNSKNG